jgi:hypothetical protein
MTIALVDEQPPHLVPQGGTTLPFGGEGVPIRERNGCYATPMQA